ncbi:hypothetical protein F0562_031179 [Nyssa sinensis]|uniref:Glycosyltransferase n=1 Tax=Nyssa sinensis TaxID=561372 RepID=A0A5J5AV82_9ASTE|nr:hypothetical protein F0562_031179 [Nyssa sinensis]
MEDVIVLYPSPGIGHLVSMVELGKFLLNHNPSFSIIILVTKAPYNTGSTAPYISSVSATTSSITFHHLPTVPLPSNSSRNFIDLSFEIPRLNNANVHQVLQFISKKSRLKAFIMDFFCNAAFEVSTSLNIPTFYFYTSGANCLAIFLHLPALHEKTTKSIKDLNTCLEFPGVPPINTRDMPETLFDRNSMAYKNFINTANQMAKSSGIIANTFSSFEPRAIKAIANGVCIPNAPTPPVFYVGPLIASNHQTGGGRDEHECLTWLNSQPSGSVVFLSFGSMGLFKAEQLIEMAIGLENSGHRFLWVVRSPPGDDETKHFLATPEPDLNALLPKGFLDRTKDKGLVVKSWAPQLAVLNHESVGGFVTHCGWNSTLEAVCAGVPMVAWPLYAEQRLNRVFLVEEMKVALKLNELNDGSVIAAEFRGASERVDGLGKREGGERESYGIERWWQGRNRRGWLVKSCTGQLGPVVETRMK